MGDGPAKLNEKKSHSGGEKMRNPSGHQGENERAKKSEQQQLRHFLHKTCN